MRNFYPPAFLCLIGLGAAVCIAQTTPPAQPTSPAQPASAAPSPAAAAPAKMSDETFVREASAAGLAEVADAEKALKMAKSDDVRRVAQQIRSDHMAANAKLKTLAEKKNLAVATTPAPTKAPTSPSGDFDADYVAAQIQAHEAAITLFKSQVSSGRDKELREFAMSTLPTLEQHLSMVQNLKQR